MRSINTANAAGDSVGISVGGAETSPRGVIAELVLFTTFVSPPPLTAALLTKLAGALEATFTVSVIGE